MNVYSWIALLLLLLPISCTHEKRQKQYVVAVSEGATKDAWQESMLLDMKIEAPDYPELSLIIENSADNNETQIEHIRHFIKQKVDVLIILPNESEAITPIAVEAYRKGIPTIIIDRKINSDEYTTSIGVDNYEIGHLAGIFATSQIKENANILEIWGRKGSSTAQGRHKGFSDVITTRKNVTIQEIEGNWKPEIIADAIDSLDNIDQIDLVFAHNDLMALAAREAIEKKDSNVAKRIQFIGIDALPGEGLGVEAVAQGKLAATFYNPVCGSLAIQIAMQIIRGESVAKRYVLNSVTIDKNNAGTLYLQSNRIIDYQQQIDKQQNNLNQLLSRYQYLESSMAIILVLMILLIALAAYVVYINRKIRRKNRLLYQTNQQVEQQRKELAEAYRCIEQATTRKLQFFTNVSHEVKTPLTLILGPLNKMRQEVKSESPMADDLQIMQKNAMRLKRVIDQLLDFRKVESNKINLRISQIDLVAFIREVKTYFDNMAKSKKINYEFNTELLIANAWADTDKMEKILTNLLSNAFKFTPEGGTISIHLDEENENWIFSVEDNGVGIPQENLSAIFEQFFTGKQNYAQGTGIGLHLTREFVNMHKGKIFVESEPFKKTIFTISFPKGKSHFDESCTLESNITELSHEVANLNISEVKENLSKQYDYTLLITEDDPDILSYLQKELSANFNTLIAHNGIEAINILKDKEVNLVISDVLMPEMNGFELCKQIKSTIAFSHIPVILLTALSDDNQQMHGLTEGADDYIQKPFNIEIVKIRILRLLESRKQLQQHFTHQMSTLSEPQIHFEKVESMDNLFLKKFIQLLEENYNDPNFNIEKGSEKLGLSRVHLYRKIKELTGTTPTEFLRDFRLKRAAMLLKQKAGTISDIAYATGFTSPAYFSKCFKTVYSITPTEYIDSL